MVLMEHRNLKSENNRYMDSFKEFVETMEKVEIHGTVNTTVFAKLQKLMRESKSITEFAKKIALEYIPSVDEKLNTIEGNTEQRKRKENRALFTQESEENI